MFLQSQSQSQLFCSNIPGLIQDSELLKMEINQSTGYQKQKRVIKHQYAFFSSSIPVPLSPCPSRPFKPPSNPCVNLSVPSGIPRLHRLLCHLLQQPESILYHWNACSGTVSGGSGSQLDDMKSGKQWEKKLYSASHLFLPRLIYIGLSYSSHDTSCWVCFWSPTPAILLV